MTRPHKAYSRNETLRCMRIVLWARFWNLFRPVSLLTIMVIFMEPKNPKIMSILGTSCLLFSPLFASEAVGSVQKSYDIHSFMNQFAKESPRGVSSG